MKILQLGTKYSFRELTALHDKLPVGNYLLKQDPQSGEYYLEEKKEFKLPSKIYGDHSDVDRWLTSYNANDKNLGIILSGLKGTGKTITAQKLCNDSNLPVIIITTGYRGTEFVDFMSQAALKECVVFVDEFEKVYDKRHDDLATLDFLSLMDGNFKSHKIFLLTVNEFRIDEYLINRPSRIKYRKKYNNLEVEIMESVIDDLLINTKHKKSILDFFDKLSLCTYDLLVEMIKEVNLFNESALICANYLNLEIQKHRYDIIELRNDKKLDMCSRQFSLFDEKLNVERNWLYSLDDKQREALNLNDLSYEFTINLKDSKITRLTNGFKIENSDGIFELTRFTLSELIF